MECENYLKNKSKWLNLIILLCFSHEDSFTKNFEEYGKTLSFIIELQITSFQFVNLQTSKSWSCNHIINYGITSPMENFASQVAKVAKLPNAKHI